MAINMEEEYKKYMKLRSDFHKLVKEYMKLRSDFHKLVKDWEYWYPRSSDIGRRCIQDVKKLLED